MESPKWASILYLRSINSPICCLSYAKMFCFDISPEVSKTLGVVIVQWIPPWTTNQLSMKFFLLISVKMPTIVGILTFMSRKNSILCLSEPEKS